jgi:DNA-directed RNA polymerase alpha subunit
MRKLSRRQNENLKKIKNVVHSSLEEAITLLQDTATASQHQQLNNPI